MPRRSVVCVVTSEKTWPRLETYCFNASFKANREQFDLAVVFNGKDSEGKKYVERFSPELFCERPNTGLDLAAYDHLIKRVGVYESYVLLLDGHWFHDPSWLRVLQTLLDTNPGTDAFGNLVDARYTTSVFLDISAILGYGEYEPADFPYFLQGLAGIYRRRIIEKVLELDGFPHIHRNIKEVAEVCERLFSFMLCRSGFVFGQIPPGYEQYLKHRDFSSDWPAYKLTEDRYRYFRERLQSQPGNRPFLWECLTYCQDNGLLEEAAGLTDRYLECSPGDTGVLHRQADVCCNLGLLEEARESIESVLRAEPERKGASELRDRIVRMSRVARP